MSENPFVPSAENTWETPPKNETLAELQVVQHPDKTFVGKLARGFSFLGYEFNASGLIGIARPTRQKFVERISQLYEQNATSSRIGEYV